MPFGTLLGHFLLRGCVCVEMPCGGGYFTPDGAYDSVWDSVKPMTGKFIFIYFQYQEVVGCVCTLNSWISCNDDIYPDNYNYFWDSVKPMKENTPSIPSCTKSTFGASACSLTGTAATTLFAPTTTTSRFKLKDKCRSEKWEVYLYGDMTIKVMVFRRAENCGGLRSCSSWRDGMS